MEPRSSHGPWTQDVDTHRLGRGLDRLLRRVDVGRVLDDNIAQDHSLGGTTRRTPPRGRTVDEGVADPVWCGRVDGVAVLDVEQEALPDEGRVAGVLDDDSDRRQAPASGVDARHGAADV